MRISLSIVFFYFNELFTKGYLHFAELQNSPIGRKWQSLLMEITKALEKIDDKKYWQILLTDSAKWDWAVRARALFLALI